MDKPWLNEPDKHAWTDEATGLGCCARRGFGGNWCGYVRVPPSHPWFGVGYDDLEHVQVHGGLTFSGPLSEDEEKTGVHHWVGFDCGHGGDLRPDYFELFGDGEYRTLDYVMENCAELAAQVEAREKLGPAPKQN